MKLNVTTPCCKVPAVINSKKAMQDHRCTKCGDWWRVDVSLVQREPKPDLVQWVHRLEWTHIGKV